jgi:hypothetical protein
MQTMEPDALSVFDQKVEAFKAEQERPYLIHQEAAAGGVPTGPRIRHRETWVDVHPEEYPGFKFRMWANFPSELLLDVLRAGVGETAAESEAAQDRGIAALNQIVVEHNGWLTEDGRPFPPANTPEFWGPVMPNELGALIIAQIQLTVRALPNSLLATRRR